MMALGLMSGTSMDGIDAALVTTDGEHITDRGPHLDLPYPPAFQNALRALLGRDARGEPGTDAVVRDLTLRHAQAVARLLDVAGLAPADVAVIGFHGQTTFHDPDAGLTVQLGDPALLARETGIPVVADFRLNDVAAGGQGAPFAPLYHAALAASSDGDLERPLAVLNVGGVANVTWIGADGAVLAFDTGPGNALLDDWCRRTIQRPMDEGGRLAKAGEPDGLALMDLLAHPYFRLPAPKSLDRDAFSAEPVAHLSPADGAATLVAFTAGAVARAKELLPAPPTRWLVCGGGRRNHELMAYLCGELQAAVDPVEAVGWQGDALEAQAFAFLAVRSLRGLALSLPTTTGVPEPCPGGRRYDP
ncbi:MAG: anhydro-N-acetylmuramic acid kinase [Rhodobacterales bacterium]|nr:anhydro-N-acetylmuramic acid kinase [Rhodobacterales bacterium]